MFCFWLGLVLVCSFFVQLKHCVFVFVAATVPVATHLCTCLLHMQSYSKLAINIRYKSLKSLPVQSVLRVPVQKLRALNRMETDLRKGPFRSFLLHLRVKVLQLQLANTAPGFVLRRLSAFLQQKQQNQQNLWWLRLCV